MGFKGNQRKGSPCSRKRWHLQRPLENAGPSQKCIALKAHSCYNDLWIIRLKPKPASSTPLTLLVLNKPSPSNYELPPASLDSGKARGSATKQGGYLGMSTAGSRKDLIPP